MHPIPPGGCKKRLDPSYLAADAKRTRNVAKAPRYSPRATNGEQTKTRLNNMMPLYDARTNVEPSTTVCSERKPLAENLNENRLPSIVVPEQYDLFVWPDADNSRFYGTVRIKINVREPASQIVLNAVELRLQHAVVDAHEVADIIVNQNEQIATLKFNNAIERGTHVLSIDYWGKISVSAQGLFVSQYDTLQGSKRLLATHFEPGNARRFVPCWDEPARKATFTLAVVAPKDMLVVSNMPVDTESELDDKRIYVRFQKTPKMSSYLLFLAIGELERLEAVSGSTIISLIAKKGSAEKGKFALESAANLLKFYNRYFGVPYPLPKLDMIAVPAAGGFSAMENWGAIMYFEDQLLLDEEWSTESNRQRVFVVIAHEMAHQWFGNLVTMEWWDNLWLNEGFASWMESKATDTFHGRLPDPGPTGDDWMIWLQAESALQRTMRQDAKRTTHPVVQPVISVEQAAFDDITYRKGRAVIRMLENYLGDDAFREGVRAYMKLYKYKNTVTDNLWDELEKASGKKIKEIANDFTTKPGVPLIIIEDEKPDGNGTTLTLRQKRFGVDESAEKETIWHVPVSAPEAGLPKPPKIIAGPESVSMTVEGHQPPIKINVGQTVYYRSNYNKDALSNFIDRFSELAPADQLGLLNDSWALGEAGVGRIEDYLDLTGKVSPAADRFVWCQIIDTLVAVDSLYPNNPNRDKFQAYAQKILSPILARVGWDKKTGELSNDTVLRESLIIGLGQLGDHEVEDKTNALFVKFVGPPINPQALPAAIRRPVLQTVALRAGEDQYDTIYKLAIEEIDSFRKDQFFVALASAQDTSLAQRTLRIALDNKPAKTTGPKMIERVAVNNSDLAWHFALNNLDSLNSRLDEAQRHTFVPSLTAQSTDPKILDELRQFIESKVPEPSQKKAEKFVADLEFRLKVINDLLPKIDEWLTSWAGRH
jgi:aminopeptidase N